MGGGAMKIAKHLRPQRIFATKFSVHSARTEITCTRCILLRSLSEHRSNMKPTSEVCHPLTASPALPLFLPTVRRKSNWASFQRSCRNEYRGPKTAPKIPKYPQKKTRVLHELLCPRKVRVNFCLFFERVTSNQEPITQISVQRETCSDELFRIFKPLLVSIYFFSRGGGSFVSCRNADLPYRMISELFQYLEKGR